MMRRAALFFFLASLAGCAGTLYSSGKATSTSAPDDAFTCIQDQLGKLGYKRKSYDSGERWYVGQKADPTARLADVRFRQRVNRLDTRVRPDASGNSAIEIKAQTFDQFDNQQGLSETEIPASALVKQDAQALIGACGK
jgi:hypothetical protein